MKKHRSGLLACLLRSDNGKYAISFRLLFHSAVFRLAFLMFIIIVPICILTMLMSISAIHMAENQVSDDIREALDLNMNQLDNYLQNIARRLYTVSRDNNDYAELIKAEADDEADPVELMHAYMRLGSVLDGIQSEYTWADSVFACFPAHDYFISSKSYQLQEFRKTVEQEALRANAPASRWAVSREDPGLLLGIFEYKNTCYGASFTLEALLSHITLDTSASRIFFATLEEGILTEDEAFAGVDPFSSDPNVTVGTERYIILTSSSQHSDLILVDLVSRTQLDQTLPGYMRILLVISIIFLLCIPVLFVFFGKWLVKPVNILIEAIGFVDRGDLDYRIAQKTGAYEFDLLNNNFNEMMDSVKDLKINVYEKELERQDIRLQYLSQQIQPHFILNAMNIIYSYEPDEYDLIQKMVLCLSKYFQFIVNANSPYVKIHHEMDHIENYLQIQKIRYGDRIQYRVEVEETAEDAVMPPLMIQNLVENVIKYALRDDAPVDIIVRAELYSPGALGRSELNDPREPGGRDQRTVASAHEVADVNNSRSDKKGAERWIRITIRDTGYGIKDETLQLIEQFQKTKIRQEGLGTGIQNTIERLELFFGSEAQFEARRWNHDEGTQITLIFPARFL